MRFSLSRKFLLGLGITAVAFTSVGTLSAFMVFQRETAQRQVAYLSDYVHERTDNIGRAFSDVHAVQAAAVAALQRRLPSLSPEDAKRVLDWETPLRPDGTRRSRPQAFDGEVEGNGQSIYGIGAFISNGAHLPPADARALAAAYPIVASFGQAAHGRYDNF
jgi:hypothetical protein